MGQFGSDAIVLDLEDAVADPEKVRAREMVAAALERYADTTTVAVRVNGMSTGLLEEDIGSVAGPSLHCLVVPKVEDEGLLPEVDVLVERLESERELRSGTISLLALIETAAGLVRCEQIAFSAPPRALTLVFGLGDFTADLGIDPTSDGLELLYARSGIVVAARAAGLAQPID
jgi:citrate lyase subunit beta/citryl-CoA lyase